MENRNVPKWKERTLIDEAKHLAKITLDQMDLTEQMISGEASVLSSRFELAAKAISVLLVLSDFPRSILAAWVYAIMYFGKTTSFPEDIAHFDVEQQLHTINRLQSGISSTTIDNALLTETNATEASSIWLAFVIVEASDYVERMELCFGCGDAKRYIDIKKKAYIFLKHVHPLLPRFNAASLLYSRTEQKLKELNQFL